MYIWRARILDPADIRRVRALLMNRHVVTENVWVTHDGIKPDNAFPHVNPTLQKPINHNRTAGAYIPCFPHASYRLFKRKLGRRTYSFS